MNEPLDLEQLDIGHPSPAVFVGVDWDPQSGWKALFISRYGDTYALDQRCLELRMRYLESQGMETGEEKRALRALLSRSS